jgi:hypothetical protein
MTRIQADHVGRAVSEASEGAEDPSHVATVVGAFLRSQPMIGHYVQAHARDLSLEGTVLVLLHASVVARAVEIAIGRALGACTPSQLDEATRVSTIATDEPHLWAYLEGNLAVDDPTLGGPRHKTALELLGTVATALRAAVDDPPTVRGRRR